MRCDAAGVPYRELWQVQGGDISPVHPHVVHADVQRCGYHEDVVGPDVKGDGAGGQGLTRQQGGLVQVEARIEEELKAGRGMGDGWMGGGGRGVFYPGGAQKMHTTASPDTGQQ